MTVGTKHDRIGACGLMNVDRTSEDYPLDTLYVYMTEGCNLRCRHCWLDPDYDRTGKKKATLDPALFGKVLAEAKPLGLTSVKLTGGEPFLHPAFDRIAAAIKKEQLGIVVETNGVLCSPEYARILKDADEQVFVSVSFDGVNAETHEWVRGVKGSFDAALKGFQNLKNVGITPQIIMTIMKRNVDQMEAMVRFAQELGAHSVKFNLIQPTARGESMHEAGETLTIQELVRTGEWVEKKLIASSQIMLFYSHPPAFQPLGKMFSTTGSGCGRCGIFGILGLLANGSYALCGIGEDIPELVFGQAGTDSLEHVWKHDAVLNELREGMPHKLEGVCSRCIHRGFCLGSCIAQNYYRKQSLWAPYWFCQDAQDASIFPLSRLRASVNTE